MLYDSAVAHSIQVSALTESAVRSSSGFTLIEVLIVLAILSSLFSLVGLGVISKWRDAKTDTTRAQIALLSQALDGFVLDNDSYPTTDEGLMVLIDRPSKSADHWRGPYLQKSKLPHDAWGHEFQYTGESPRKFQICSAGPDGARGTDDDICSED